MRPWTWQIGPLTRLAFRSSSSDTCLMRRPLAALPRGPAPAPLPPPPTALAAVFPAGFACPGLAASRAIGLAAGLGSPGLAAGRAPSAGRPPRRFTPRPRAPTARFARSPCSHPGDLGAHGAGRMGRCNHWQGCGQKWDAEEEESLHRGSRLLPSRDNRGERRCSGGELLWSVVLPVMVPLLL